MSWFWLALVGPVVWSLSNHIDKALISKYLYGKSSAPLVLISALAGIFTSLAIWIYLGDVILPFPYILAFIIIGALETCYLFPYFKALESGEASMVAPLFQLMPLMYFVVAFFLLGETLSAKQMIGSTLVLTGSFISVIDVHTFRWKWKIFFLILLSCSILVFSGVLFKGFALEESFAKGVFWQSFGAFLLGVFLLFLPEYRKASWELMRRSKSLFSINVFNEILSLTGYVAMRYASFIVPIALANTVLGFQPLFIFLWGALGIALFPSLGFEEDLSKKAILKKLLAALFLLVGAWLIQ